MIEMPSMTCCSSDLMRHSFVKDLGALTQEAAAIAVRRAFAALDQQPADSAEVADEVRS